MSIKVMSQVWDHCPQKAESLIVMLALADWCNDAGECWPAIPALASKARITDRAVFKIINRLESLGEIEITAGRGRGNRSGYRLPRYVTAESRAGSHSAQTPPARHRIHEPRSGIRMEENLNAATIKPERGDTENLNAATLHIEEPSFLTVKEPSVGAPTVAAPLAPALPAPAKRSKTKAPARPFGPGSTVYRDLANLSPNNVQREQLEAVFEAHGEEKLRAVVKEWLARGFSPRNVAGMVEVVEQGWRQNGRTNGNRPAAVSTYGSNPDDPSGLKAYLARQNAGGKP